MPEIINNSTAPVSYVKHENTYEINYNNSNTLPHISSINNPENQIIFNNYNNNPPMIINPESFNINNNVIYIIFHKSSC